MKSNAFDQIEIHSSFIEDGISTMRKIDNLRISENSEMKLEPGGYHLMLMSPKKDIKEGNLVELIIYCLLYTSPSPRDLSTSRMPSSA